MPLSGQPSPSSGPFATIAARRPEEGASCETARSVTSAVVSRYWLLITGCCSIGIPPFLQGLIEPSLAPRNKRRRSVHVSVSCVATPFRCSSTSRCQNAPTAVRPCRVAKTHARSAHCARKAHAARAQSAHREQSAPSRQPRNNPPASRERYVLTQLSATSGATSCVRQAVKLRIDSRD